MKIAIAAVDKKYGIGWNNKLLFRIPRDQKFFKTITTGYPVVMGRKTFESMGCRILENRYNIIITSLSESKFFEHHPSAKRLNNLCIMSLGKLREKFDELEQMFNTIFIIGGASIYRELLPECNKLLLTKYDKLCVPKDTYFPEDMLDHFRYTRSIECGFYKSYQWLINEYVTRHA